LLAATAVAALAGFPAGGAVAPPEDVAADQVQVGIENSETQWNADLAAHDAAKVASYYAENGWLMAPGFTAPVQGRTAIQRTMTQLCADPNFSLTFEQNTVKASVGGNEAYSRGTFTETVSGPSPGTTITFSGTYLRIYRPESGAQAAGAGVALASGPYAVWKVVEDISAGGPPPGAPKTGGGS
jgi:ketosteroid isomerase-like protein